MKNRERLMNQSLYDTLIEMNKILLQQKDFFPCIMYTLTDSAFYERCNGECDKCIADWLNEEAK